MLLDPNTPDDIPLIIDANEAACLAHGYSREEFIGRPVSDIDDDEGKNLVKKRTAEIMRGKTFFVENNHVRKDGTFFPVAITAKRIDIKDGKPLILSTEYDLTERKRAEEDIKRMENELIQSKKMESIGTLAGGIAHEFNNMLAIIIGNNEIIMDELPKSSLMRERVLKISELQDYVPGM